MMDKQKKKEVTGSGVSDLQSPAVEGSTVPASPRSSSSVGLPAGSTGSSAGDTAISVLARGMARSFGQKEGGMGRRPIGEKDSGGAGPEAIAGPSGIGKSAASAASGRRPGPKTSLKSREGDTVSRHVVEPFRDDEDLSEAMSEVVLSDDELSPYDESPETSKAESAYVKRPVGRPPTTRKWVGVEAVRQELAALKKEHDRVMAERDILAGRLESDFGATAGGIPSADQFMQDMKDETVDSLFNIMLELLQAVDSVADRSGNLKGTLKSKLRHSARRGVAAAKLMFTRATADVSIEDGTADHYRRELKAAKVAIGQADERIRQLEQEVRMLQDRETLRGDSASRKTPPRRRARQLRISSDEESMEIEAPLKEPTIAGSTSPKQKTPVRESAPSGAPPSDLDWIENVVERVMSRLRPSGLNMADAPSPGPSPQEAGRTGGTERSARQGGFVPPSEKGPASTVSRRKKRRPASMGMARSELPKKKKKEAAKAVGPGKKGTKKRVKKAGIVREPRTAAVMLSVAPQASTTLAQVLRNSRPIAQEIPGLLPASIKKARAGGVLIQLGGSEGRQHAEVLAQKVKELTRGEKGVRVVCPRKYAELRIMGLDASITPHEVVQSIVELTGCSENEITLGPIRDAPNRAGSIWIRCPAAVNNKLLETGKWFIGWSRVTAKPLPARPMRCFRCLEVGHAAVLCRGVDRSNRCYRCGSGSHISSACTAVVPKCPLCSDFGLPAGHLLGAASCVPNRRVAERKRAALRKEGERADIAKDVRDVGVETAAAPSRAVRLKDFVALARAGRGRGSPASSPEKEFVPPPAKTIRLSDKTRAKKE